MSLQWRDFFRFITNKYSSAKALVEAGPATACTGALAYPFTKIQFSWSKINKEENRGKAYKIGYTALIKPSAASLSPLSVSEREAKKKLERSHCAPMQHMKAEFRYHEDYTKNSRGVELFACRWIPSSSPKALVFLCHGYGMECSDSMRECGVRLASAGYAVFGMDYEGHGRSMGARCYIKKFENIVNDCYDYYTSICAQEEYMEKGRFLYGESMGGAVALLLHKKDPSFWNGAILVAPMCKISEKVKPHPVVISLLTRVEEVIPKWKIVPTKNVINAAFKDLAKREEVKNNKLIYQDKPRLKTALEMLRTSMNLEDSLDEITVPFFVLHGEADIVTDPEISKALYEKASSRDKTLKLYPGMWHALTSGEPDHNVDLVFADITNWLDHRTADSSASLTVTPIRAITTTASVERVTVTSNGKRRAKRTYLNLLCGLNGGRLVPRSGGAM